MSGFIKTPFDIEKKRIFVAGHNGMVGRAIVKRLQGESVQIITAARHMLDLTNQSQTNMWFNINKPDIVLIAAARVGGIGDNAAHPADFITDNILIQTNIMRAAHENDVQKLVFLGSSCIYPKHAAQPITEDALMTGTLEPTNESYAVAKIAGITMAQSYRKQYGRDFISLMPCNLYGPYDNFDQQSGHVIPALIAKTHMAKQDNTPLNIRGSGKPLREFMHADDAADAIIFALKHYSHEIPLNIGSGEEVSIKDLASIIAETAGFKGKIIFDHTKPDGTPRKLMDSSRVKNAGWTPKIPLRLGVEQTYQWYLENREQSVIRANPAQTDKAA